jgi:hypothetical protein
MRLIFYIAFIAFPAFVLADSPASTVTFVRENKVVTIPQEIRLDIIAEMLATLKATAYESTSYAGSEKQWNMLAKSYLLLVYNRPTKVTVHGYKKEVVADEILIPISSDNHYLVRNTHTKEYWAFTKMIPEARAKLICRKEFLVESNRNFCKFLGAP